MRYLFFLFVRPPGEFFRLAWIDNDPQQSLLLLRKSLTERKAPKAHFFCQISFLVNWIQRRAFPLSFALSKRGTGSPGSGQSGQACWLFEHSQRNLDHFYFFAQTQLHCELINCGMYSIKRLKCSLLIVFVSWSCEIIFSNLQSSKSIMKFSWSSQLKKNRRASF